MPNTLVDMRPYVFKYTDRPDLETETDAAVTAALVSSHLHKDFSPFYFDLAEESYPNLLNSGTFFSLILPNRFRGPAKFAVTLDGRQLKYVPPSALFDEHSLMQQTDIFYLAGANFSVRLSAAAEHISLGYYKLPSITDSWIATNMPELLALKAAVTIASSVHNTERAKTFNALWLEQMATLHAAAFDL